MTYLDISDEITDEFESLWWSFCLTCSDNIHVYLACGWIGSCLLKCMLNQSHSFINISLFDVFTQSHLGESFRNADHWLKLTRGRCNGFWAIPQTAHFHILRNQVHLDGVRNLRPDVLSGVRDVLSEELSINLVGSEELSILFWLITSINCLNVFSQIGIQWDYMISKSSIYGFWLFVQDEVD